MPQTIEELRGGTSDGTHWYYYVDGDTIEQLWEVLYDLNERSAPGDTRYDLAMDELNRIADTVNPW
jgi:hypothetical protein